MELDEGEYNIYVHFNHTDFKDPEYFKKSVETGWDHRKLSRILTERSKSQSIISNFCPGPLSTHSQFLVSDSVSLPSNIKSVSIESDDDILELQDVTDLEENINKICAQLYIDSGIEEALNRVLIGLLHTHFIIHSLLKMLDLPLDQAYRLISIGLESLKFIEDRMNISGICKVHEQQTITMFLLHNLKKDKETIDM
ncbi:hypothetical protein DXG01_003985 [Tephrocybe rancida]|nr:hypothetical protein DXG01_003985 [Tephrocybe rancida]